MNITNDAIRFIMLNEGMRLEVYKDFGGNLTCGFGHRVTAKDNLKFPDKISEDEATDFLIKDLHTAAEAIDSLRLDINQNQYDALLDFTFNCGVNNLYRLTKNGCRSSEQIYAALPLYDKCGKNHLKSLHHRRLREQQLWNGVKVDEIFHIAEKSV